MQQERIFGWKKTSYGVGGEGVKPPREGEKKPPMGAKLPRATKKQKNTKAGRETFIWGFRNPVLVNVISYKRVEYSIGNIKS